MEYLIGQYTRAIDRSNGIMLPFKPDLYELNVRTVDEARYLQLSPVPFGDGQVRSNRVWVGRDLLDWVGIQDEARIVGCGSYVEIWSPERLQAYRSQRPRTLSALLSP